jgi:adhesin transport system outer membrane protein
MAIGLQYTGAIASAEEPIPPGPRVISPSRLQAQPSAAAPTAVLSAAHASHAVNLQQAVRRALDWHPAIGEAVGTLYQQAEGINVAEAGYYPQISGGLNSGYESGYSGGRSTQVMRVSLRQMLYDFGKVSSDVDIAQARTARSQASILLAIDQIARDTAQAYIEVQRYQHLLELAREQTRGIGAIVELAQQRSDLGASTRSDVVQAHSRAAGAMATLQEYKAQHARWQANLSNLLGWQTPPHVGKHYPTVLASACEADGISDALPAVLEAAARRNEAQAELARARADGYPTLSLEPSINHNLNSNYNRNNPAVDRTQVGIFLNFEVPIYQGGATGARSRAASHALTSADSAEDYAKLQARQGLAQAQAQTSGLLLRLESLERRQASISEARNLYGRQYLELGTRPLLDLLNAEQEIHQSRFDLANTQADMHRLQIDCLYNNGGLRRAFGIDHSTIQRVEILP